MGCCSGSERTVTEMKILCFGDSNTYGYDPRACFGGRYPPEDRWVDILAAESGWEVINCGENGREIPRYFYGAEQLLARQQPDVLAVMLGTNDLLQGASVSQVRSRMEAFLRYIQRTCQTILLIAPPPMKLGAWVPEENLVTASMELADAHGSLAQELGIAFADAGKWNVELTFDGVHFSGAGNRNFAEGMLAKLRES